MQTETCSYSVVWNEAHHAIIVSLYQAKTTEACMQSATRLLYKLTRCSPSWDLLM
jgi:hypothetical protein